MRNAFLMLNDCTKREDLRLSIDHHKEDDGAKCSDLEMYIDLNRSFSRSKTYSGY